MDCPMDCPMDWPNKPPAACNPRCTAANHCSPNTATSKLTRTMRRQSRICVKQIAESCRSDIAGRRCNMFDIRDGAGDNNKEGRVTRERCATGGLILDLVTSFDFSTFARQRFDGRTGPRRS